MLKKIIRKHPQQYYSPVGNYTHITKIPAELDTYQFSGQIGIASDGTIPSDFNDEVAQLFINIKTLLKSEGIEAENITKVNIWSVEPIDWDFFDQLWDDYFKEDYPSMTIAYVQALGLPEIKIEIDISAAK
ncbi:RidA family protein [Erysipelothrix urinaevulpis]|uniref:RidA family protein n=1 Tax=Erysipelothrix urinaevulpis TaxID=2683717 RepID=UPI0013590FD9|nr:RidA family protein [Erysipelothrix urinaevulpis]